MMLTEEQIAQLLQAYARAADGGNTIDGGDMNDFGEMVNNPLSLAGMNFEPRTEFTPYFMEGTALAEQLANSSDLTEQAIGQALLSGATSVDAVLRAIEDPNDEPLKPEDDGYIARAQMIERVAGPAINSLRDDMAKRLSGEVVETSPGQFAAFETEEHPYMNWARNAGFQNLPGDQWDYRHEWRDDPLTDREIEKRTRAYGIERRSADDVADMRWRAMKKLRSGLSNNRSGNIPEAREDEYRLAYYLRTGDPSMTGRLRRPQGSIGMPRQTAHDTAGRRQIAEAQELKKAADYFDEVNKRRDQHQQRAAQWREERDREQREAYNRNMAARGLTPHTVEAITRKLGL